MLLIPPILIKVHFFINNHSQDSVSVNTAIVRATAISLVLFVSSSKISRNRAATMFKISGSRGVIIARYDAILNFRGDLYNHLSNLLY